MAHPKIQSWTEANDYINAGRSKTERPLFSAWRIKRVDNDGIAIIKKEDLPRQNFTPPLIYYKDGTVVLTLEYFDGTTMEMYAEYAGQELQIYGSRYHLPSLGKTPDNYQPCNGCDATGQRDTNCYGPSMCLEVDHIPAHLLETGAPGAHCSHFETERHALSLCEHGNKEGHPYKVQCHVCEGNKQRNYGGKINYQEWPTVVSATGLRSLAPLKIKDGQVIQ